MFIFLLFLLLRFLFFNLPLNCACFLVFAGVCFCIDFDKVAVTLRLCCIAFTLYTHRPILLPGRGMNGLEVTLLVFTTVDTVASFQAMG